MKVYTRELDDILYEHPALEFAAVIESRIQSVTEVRGY